MVVQLNQQEFEQSLEVLSYTEQMRATQWKISRKYSTVEIIPITLASADKTLDGYYYSKAVGPVRSARDKDHNMKPEEVTEELKKKIRANIHMSWF